MRNRVLAHRDFSLIRPKDGCIHIWQKSTHSLMPRGERVLRCMRCRGWKEWQGYMDSFHPGWREYEEGWLRADI